VIEVRPLPVEPRLSLVARKSRPFGAERVGNDEREHELAAFLRPEHVGQVHAQLQAVDVECAPKVAQLTGRGPGMRGRSRTIRVG